MRKQKTVLCGTLAALLVTALPGMTVCAEPEETTAAVTTEVTVLTSAETVLTSEETTETTTTTTAVTRAPVSAMTYEETANGIKITSYRWLNELTVEIPAQIGGKPVCEIGPNAFQYCYADEILLPSSLLIIHDYAFAGCAYLKTLTVPDGCRYIGSHAFDGCEKLEAVTIPATVTDIGADAFAETPFFTSLTDEFAVFGKGVLCACRSISDAPVIPDGVITIAPQTFAGNTGIHKVTIPASVQRIQKKAFEGCTGLSQIDISGTPVEVAADAFAGTKWEESTQNGFLRLNDLFYAYRGTAASVTVPEDIRVIGEGAFAGNEKLVSAELPETLEEIGRNAFSGDTALVSVRVGKHLKKLGANAFSGCEKLTELYLPDTLEEIGEHAAGYRINAETGAAEPLNNGLTVFADAEAAVKYAADNSLKREPLPASEQTVPVVTEPEPEVTEEGFALPQDRTWIPAMLCGGVLLLAGIVVFVIRKRR